MRTYDLLRKSPKRAKLRAAHNMLWTGGAAIAIYHASTKPISRSSGRSSVAAAAYRAGALLVDERQGMVHDYTQRSGVVSAEVVMPDGQAPADREALWNAAEAAEKRKDARTAREWVVALPDELGADGRQQLVRSFAGTLANRYGVAVDVAVHAPDREGDQRNHHAHLLVTTRQVSRDDAGDLVLGNKASIELSDKARKARGLGRAAEEVSAVRELWAEHVNGALARAGAAERVDHRSLQAQRESALDAGDLAKAAELDREPTSKLGWQASQDLRRAAQFSSSAEKSAQPKTDRAQQHQALPGVNAERRQQAGIVTRLEALGERVQAGVSAVMERVEAHKARVDAERKAKEAERERARLVASEARQAGSAKMTTLERAVFYVDAAVVAPAKRAGSIVLKQIDMIRAHFTGRLAEAESQVGAFVGLIRRELKEADVRRDLHRVMERAGWPQPPPPPDGARDQRIREASTGALIGAAEFKPEKPIAEDIQAELARRVAERGLGERPSSEFDAPYAATQGQALMRSLSKQQDQDLGRGRGRDEGR